MILNQVWANIGYQPNAFAQELRGLTFWLPMVGPRVGGVNGTVLVDEIVGRTTRWTYNANGCFTGPPRPSAASIASAGSRFTNALRVYPSGTAAHHPQFLSVPTGSLLGNTWTVMFWAKSDSLTSDLFTWGFYDNGTDQNRNMPLGLYDGGLNIGDGTDYQLEAGLAIGVNSSPTEWQHVAWVDDGTNYIAYRDGIQVASAGITYNPSLDVTRTLYVTRSGFTSSGLWDSASDGHMADFRVYNRGLSPNEIRAIGSQSVIPQREPAGRIFTTGIEFALAKAPVGETAASPVAIHRPARQSVSVPQMAPSFDRASSQRMLATGYSLNVPVTLSCWFYSAGDLTNSQILLALTYAGNDNKLSIELAGHVASDPLLAVTCTSSCVYAQINGYPTDGWHHACGVFAGVASRSVFLDGGSKNTNTGSRTVNQQTQIEIGSALYYGQGGYVDGAVTNPAVWSAALSDAEVAALGAGENPMNIRPGALEAYWETTAHGTGLVDRIRGKKLTLYNSPAWTEGPPRARSLWQVPEIRRVLAPTAATTTAPVAIRRPARRSVRAPQMARTFNGTSSYLYNASTPVTTFPISMSCWFRPDRATAHENLVSIADWSGGAGGHHMAIQVRGDVAGDYIRAHTNDGSADAAISTKGITVGKWHHATAVFASATDRRIYIDGGNKGTDATSNTPTNIDVCSLGGLYRNGMSFARYFDGAISHAALWQGVLTDQDALDLWNGSNPLEIKRHYLKAYWPLHDPLITTHDVVGHYYLTRQYTRDYTVGPQRAGVLWGIPEIRRVYMGEGASPAGGVLPIFIRYFRNLRT